MSYQALARKWRPRRFSEVVGQSHVLRALENALSQGRLHHAYLFTGTRGVGKTTLARLFAKSLNCEQGVGAEPCGQCSSCLEIDQGRFVDLIEIDAASRTKVEDTRELLDNVQYSPTRGRFKVYLIDEVHMLSRHSFNALLKTLEEPPPHVKFLLATTDPKKLPVTVLSRCLQFNLKHLTVAQIADQLERILAAESIAADSPALVALARAAAGSMRDALSLTDQAIAHGSGEVRTEAVQQMLGTIGREQLLPLCQALVAGDMAAVMDRVNELMMFEPDGLAVLNELALLLHNLALIQFLPERAQEADIGVPAQELQRLAEQVAAEDLQLWYQIALQGKADLPLAPEPRAGLEMILLRMLAFRPVDASQGQATATVAATQQTPQPAMQTPPLPTRANPPRQGQATRQRSAPAPQSASAPELEPAPELGPASEFGHSPGSAPQAVPGPDLMPADPAMPSEQQMAAEQSLLMDMAASHGLAHAPVQNQPQPQRSSDPRPSAGLDRLDQLRSARAQLRNRRHEARPANKNAPESGAKKSERPAAIEQRPAVPSQPGEPAMTGNLATAQAVVSVPTGVASQPAPPARPVPARPVAKVPVSPNAPTFTKRQPEPVWQGRSWPQLLAELSIGGLLRQLAMNAALEATEPHWQLTLKPEQRHLDTETNRTQLAQAIAQLIGTLPTLQLSLGESDWEVPMETRQRLAHEAWLAARDALLADRNVQTLMRQFGAELDGDTIEPVDL